MSDLGMVEVAEMDGRVIDLDIHQDPINSLQVDLNTAPVLMDLSLFATIQHLNRRACVGTSSYGPSASSAAYSAPMGAGANNGPGFWSGMLGGGLLGYMMGNRYECLSRMEIRRLLLTGIFQKSWLWIWGLYSSSCYLWRYKTSLIAISHLINILLL
jgi:hypothetical protein